MIALLLMSAQADTRPPGVLDWRTFSEVKQHASLQGDDLVFQSVDWKTRAYDGFVAGAQQDKPVLLWLYFGDPRGHC